MVKARRLDITAVTQDIRAEIEHELGMQAFVRGDADACLRHAERALDLAQNPLQRSRALGGIGDAHYAAGRMASAHRAYGACIELARANGLGVVELDYAPLETSCLHFIEPGPGTLAKAELVVERCREAGNPRDQIAALHSLGEMLIEAQAVERARSVIEEADGLIERIDAVKFRPPQTWLKAMLLIADGESSAAEKLIAEHFALEGATDVTCANLFGLMARLASEPAKRADAIAKGEALLARVSNGHAHLWFRQQALEALLASGSWTQAGIQAELLERYVRSEPLAWVKHAVRRARLIARSTQDRATPDGRAAASDLVTTLERAALNAWVPALRVAFDL